MSLATNVLKTSDVATLRKHAGAWLQQQRETCGLSQTEFAALVGVDYYSFISQIENGRGRIPPKSYKIWASALNMESRDFVTKILEFYDPYVFEILFEEDQ